MRRIAILVAILAVVGLAVAWYTRPKPIPVVLSEVAEGKVESTLANTRAGTVEACQRTKLSTIVGGRIEYLGVKEGTLPPIQMPFFFDAANLSRMRSAVTSRSNCANDSSTLRTSRPMDVAVLKDCVTEANEQLARSNRSTILEKSISERVRRSIL